MNKESIPKVLNRKLSNWRCCGNKRAQCLRGAGVR
jgi:hypothetical protein